MVWGIKDEYFAKVYGKSYKPKSGTSERRVRPEKTGQPADQTPTVSRSNDFPNQIKDAEKLQGELPFQKPKVECPNCGRWLDDCNGNCIFDGLPNHGFSG